MKPELSAKMDVLKSLLKVMYSGMAKKKGMMEGEEEEDEDEEECEEKGPLQMMAEEGGGLSDEDKKEMLATKKPKLPKFALMGISVKTSKPAMKKGK